MKPKKSTQIRIVNPVAGEAAFTYWRKAKELVERGRAKYVRDGAAIRLLEDAEIRDARQAVRDKITDETYWNAVASGRGGSSEQLRFLMKRSAAKPTMPGGPEGLAITALIPVIEQCSRQPKR